MKQCVVAFALLLAACADDEPPAQVDAAPSDDAQVTEDGAPLDAGADAWTEPAADAGHPLYRTCTPGNAGECPDIPFDGGALRAGYLLPDGGRSPECYDQHKTVKERDLYGTCLYGCGSGAVPDPALGLACGQLFADCIRPWGVEVGGPVCLPGDNPQP